MASSLRFGANKGSLFNWHPDLIMPFCLSEPRKKLALIQAKFILTDWNLHKRAKGICLYFLVQFKTAPPSWELEIYEKVDCSGAGFVMPVLISNCLAPSYVLSDYFKFNFSFHVKI